MASVAGSLQRNPVFGSHSSSNPTWALPASLNVQGPELRRISAIGRLSQRRSSSLIVRSAVEGVSVTDPPPPEDSAPVGGSKSETLPSLKLKLLVSGLWSSYFNLLSAKILFIETVEPNNVLQSAVSGLNRGLAASEEDLQKADAAAKEIEAAGGPVDLSVDIDKLQGRWKLIYSSAFSSRTLGGSRPGPPTGRLLPITLGQVFQRIDVLSRDFDNIVELELGAPWPLPPAEVTATLAHKFELIGSAKIKINFEKTTVKTTGNLAQLPPLEIPRLPDSLRPPSNTRSGEFEVTYLDSDMRITQGDRGELRVFVIA
ncbi:hypothetical protein CDL15_Pgr023708 [Punica granatum]|uniref:Plastid lipid-associated protein/fibrillin conserved domain-containing protein n=1 Tax=Punica granatum TaxID=22663 RepID=A0A218XKK7_PUNGR|nr:hypothetical protein CDL15_Pgr023708 [Punica granatum]